MRFPASALTARFEPARVPANICAAPRRRLGFGEPGDSVQIEVNGTSREVADGLTVEELVRELGLRPEVVAVELNRELVSRARRASATLAPGDEVELVTLVGGG